LPDVALWIFGADAARAERLRRENVDLAGALLVPHDLDEATRPAACALADVIAFPRSVFEPWPLLVLEAQAVGTPAVVSCYGGAAEAVLDGETGRVVDPRDVDALADALAQLLADTDLRGRLGEAAQRRVAREFSLERQVAGTLAAYERARARRKDSVA